MSDIETKIQNNDNFGIKKKISLITLIVVFAFIIRLAYGNFEIPLTADSLDYFLYASDISVNNQLPKYTIGNNGWPIFVSWFFSILKFETVLDYMQVQKVLTVILSSVTILPVYFLCRKFFDSKLSLVGAIFFAVEPRILLNASLGVTESLYILLGTSSLVLFLSQNKKLVYSSFIVASCFSMIRSEGIFLLVVISMMFFIRFRKDKLVIPKYFFVLLIFVLVLLPMVSYRIETLGHDGLTKRMVYGINAHILGSDNFSEEALEEVGTNTKNSFFINGAQNFIKYLGWDLIPLFIVFAPIGVFFLFRKMDYKKGTVIVSVIFLSLPAFYAYSIPLEDTRYFFLLYPSFIVISLFTIKKIQNRFTKQNLILIAIIIGIISVSVIFLNFEVIDYEREKEIFEISKILLRSDMKINDYMPESRYLESTNVLIDINSFQQYLLQNNENRNSVNDIIPKKVHTIPTDNFSTLKEFIIDNKDDGLTHIVSDDNNNRQEFLRDLFENESNYPFLIKEFDSKDAGFSYHLKLFKINYDQFNLE